MESRLAGGQGFSEGREKLAPRKGSALHQVPMDAGLVCPATSPDPGTIKKYRVDKRRLGAWSPLFGVERGREGGGWGRGGAGSMPKIKPPPLGEEGAMDGEPRDRGSLGP